MADVHRTAGLEDVSVAGERGKQKLLKLFRSHPVALDLQAVFRVAFVVHIIWRICKNQIHGLARQEALHISLCCGIAAEHAMVAEYPDIARESSWCLRQLRNRILVRQAFRNVLRLKQPLKLDALEANQVKVESLIVQRRQLDAQKLFVPSCAAGLATGASARLQVLPPYRACGPQELWHAPPGCHRRRQPKLDWSSQIRGSKPRCWPPVAGCAFGGCSPPESAVRSASALSGYQRSQQLPGLCS